MTEREREREREKERGKLMNLCLGYDMCFHDFIDRVGDVQTAEEGLNRDILEFTPPCKVKEYPILEKVQEKKTKIDGR